MTKAEVDKKAKKEAKKLRDLMKNLNIPDEIISLFEPVIRNTAWMKIKLDEAVESENMGQIVVEYDNGGGQTGFRESPWFKAYEALWKSYMLGMGRIIDVLPEEAAKEAEAEIQKQETVLDMIRGKHRKEA